MSLKNMALALSGNIAVTDPSGMITFVDDGVSIQNGLHLIVLEDTDYQTRRQLTAKYRPPTIDPKTGAYGKDKKGLVYVEPIVLTNGSVVFNTVRIEREVHPSVAAASLTRMNLIGAQLLTNSAMGNYWSAGSMS